MKLSEYRAQRLREDNGRDLLLASLDNLDPHWSSSFDSVRDAAVHWGLESMLDAPELDASGNPAELDFNDKSYTEWDANGAPVWE